MTPMTIDKDGLASLLERVREAKGPDRQLAMDFAAFVLNGEWRPYAEGKRNKWLYGTTGKVICYGPEESERWFVSIDASLTLVERLLPGWTYTINHRHCELQHPKLREKDARGFGATPPLAILAALLSALKELR